MYPWLFLLLAITFEVVATSFLKLSHGWTKLAPTLWALLFFPMSTAVYSLALKKIDISMAYAVWSGLGTAAMVFVGAFFFGETLQPIKLLFIALIVAGIIGLRFAGGH
jgi:small multidrug resistance pump